MLHNAHASFPSSRLNFQFNDTTLFTLDGNATGTQNITFGPIIDLERIDLNYVVFDIVLSPQKITIKVQLVNFTAISTTAREFGIIIEHSQSAVTRKKEGR